MLKILLDTSFILPTLGVDTGRKVADALKKLESGGLEVYVSRFSILESLWVIARISRAGGFDQNVFNEGIESLLSSSRYILVDENPEIFIHALQLYIRGHRDMIDNLLYSTSLAYGMSFLTLDKELEEFVVEHKLPNTIVHVEDL